jgi:hypothetical protein
VLPKPEGEEIMAIDCEVILRWDATPTQQKALGNALWDWCTREAAGGSLYEYLDNQALADLMAGRLPASGQRVSDANLPYVYFTIPGDAKRDRHGLLKSLERAISLEGISDVRIDGISWQAAKSDERCTVRGAGAASLARLAENR